MRAVLVLLVAAFAAGTASAGDIPKGPFTQTECVECHSQETPDLVSAWRGGPHASGVRPANCVACHGDQHPGSMSKARKNEACVTCHGGPDSTVSRSYFTSKHGVIATLEGARWDWSLPLTEANYRTPTCAYCHMHEGEHGMSAKNDTVTASCSECHSPRYADTMLEAAKRTLKMGELKVREAEMAISSAVENDKLSEPGAKALKTMLSKMRMKTLANLRLGLGHHSPDYQWWYGQAALDGNLIRIKALITRLHREKPAQDAPPPHRSSP